MNKKLYLKKIGTRGLFSIWLVDGSYIRKCIEPEFTNFGQHFRFPKIPKFELWLDNEAVPNERRFFIEHLLTEWQLMEKGQNYKKAINAANRKEIAERRKSDDLKKVCDHNGKICTQKVYKRLLKKINKLSVWLVFGRLVRSALDVEFTEGGHSLVYSYVPKNEVWIDNDIKLKERPYIILHELYERSLMAKGFSYSKAHQRASRLEWRVRHNYNILNSNLKKLGWL